MKIQEAYPFVKLAIEDKRLELDMTINTYDFVKRECLKCKSKSNLKLVVLEQDKRIINSNHDYSFLLCDNCFGGVFTS